MNLTTLAWVLADGETETSSAGGFVGLIVATAIIVDVVALPAYVFRRWLG
jgi:hypothetical protein